MAFLEEDDKQTGQIGQQQGFSGPQSFAPGGAAVGGAVAGGGGPGNAAQPGSGGASSWTNIQSYINANKGNTKSSDLLNQNVGSTFDAQKENLDKTSQDALQGSQTELGKLKLDSGSALQGVQNSPYNFNGPQSAAYGDLTGKAQSTLGAKYEGPKDFQFGLSGQAQEYGQGLQDNQFGGMLDNLYQKASGGKLSPGQLALQRQFDAQGDSANALTDARNNLLGKYSGLTGDVENTVKNTQNSISGNLEKFNAGQADLRSALENRIDKFKQEDVESYLPNQKDNSFATASQFNTIADMLGRNRVTAPVRRLVDPDIKIPQMIDAPGALAGPINTAIKPGGSIPPIVDNWSHLLPPRRRK